MSRLLTNLWQERTRHQDIDDMCKGLSSGGFSVEGIYFIGCGDRIVYIGQSIGMGGIVNRSMESLAKVYPQIDDITLPWSIGLSPVTDESKTIWNSSNLNELESTAIRKFAPIFNTSIPNRLKSKGKEPEIIHVAQVFADSGNNCTAFELENIERQAREAANNPSPPWEHGYERRRKRNPITNKLELREKYKER